MNFETIARVIELLFLSGIFIFVRRINMLFDRYLFERDNFPPHKHYRCDGDIDYPAGLQPAARKENHT